MAIWLLWTLVGSTQTLADLTVVNFDHLPDGTPIKDGAIITNAYAEYGVTFFCFGRYPDYWNDHNAYAYANENAFSWNNVMGGRIIGKYYNWLSPGICYGVAQFTNPVDYISIYGAGSPFQIFYFNQYGKLKGPVVSPGHSFLEISTEGEERIKKILFGSYTGNFQTYFDDLTFRMPVPQSIPVIEELSPDFCEPGSTIRIVGQHFGHDQSDGNIIHLGNWKKGHSKSPGLIWSDTEIEFKMPTYACEPFLTDQETRFVDLWITVDGIDSNKKTLKALRPTSCD